MAYQLPVELAYSTALHLRRRYSDFLHLRNESVSFRVREPDIKPVQAVARRPPHTPPTAQVRPRKVSP
jgi:hypothetical protein